MVKKVCCLLAVIGVFRFMGLYFVVIVFNVLCCKFAELGLVE